jgi:hypothetical protein
VPIKASDFYSKPTLKFLEEKFKSNEIKKESQKSHLKNAIRLAFYDKRNITPEKLANSIQSQGIHVVLRKSKDGQLYGITYVDHKTQCVFNGSNLGKEFSAKGIQESCELNMPHQEKHTQKSLISYDNFQNLELAEHLKITATDIIMRNENTTDYVPKQLKQKNKKRTRKRF